MSGPSSGGVHWITLTLGHSTTCSAHQWGYNICLALLVTEKGKQYQQSLPICMFLQESHLSVALHVPWMESLCLVSLITLGLDSSHHCKWISFCHGVSHTRLWHKNVNHRHCTADICKHFVALHKENHFKKLCFTQFLGSLENPGSA